MLTPKTTPSSLVLYADFGITTLIDPGQYENEKFAEKKSINSHYTSKVLKTINIE